MKIISIILVLATFLIGGNAYAAEYEIQSGEILSIIAPKLDHTVEELQLMNDIKDIGKIRARAVLVYISQRDLEDARSWCQDMSEKIKADSRNRQYFEAVAKMNRGDIFYVDTGKGLAHYEVILNFARYWRNR